MAMLSQIEEGIMRLFLLLLFSGSLWAQKDLYFTKGQANGLFWRGKSREVTTGIIVGMAAGRIVDSIWSLSEFPACRTHLDKATWPTVTTADLSKEVDKFYENAASVPLPIGVAVLEIFLRLIGASKADLEEFRSMVVKAYLN
jgi:hypothetical protein